jgi:hypothetical protein
VVQEHRLTEKTILSLTATHLVRGIPALQWENKQVLAGITQRLREETFVMNNVAVVAIPVESMVQLFNLTPVLALTFTIPQIIKPVNFLAKESVMAILIHL